LQGYETWSVTLIEQAESVREQVAAEETQTEGGGNGERPERLGGGNGERPERHGLWCLAYIVRVVTATGMRWAGNVACVGARRNAYIALAVKTKEHFEDLHVGGDY
jgi:hypothetical protein